MEVRGTRLERSGKHSKFIHNAEFASIKRINCTPYLLAGGRPHTDRDSDLVSFT